MTHDVAAIVARLTETQRRAVMACDIRPAVAAAAFLDIDGTFTCYVGGGKVRSTDFDGLEKLFKPVGCTDPRGAPTLFGNVYPPGLAVHSYLTRNTP